MTLTAGTSCRRSQQTLPELPTLRTDEWVPPLKEQAEKAWSEVKRKPLDAWANGKLGMILHASRQHSAAEICYRRAELLAPRELRWLYFRGLAQAEMGRLAEAAQTLRRAVDAHPEYSPVRLRLAEILLRAGDYDESQKLYEALLRGNPELPAAHYGLGQIFFRKADFTGATAHFRKACELFPGYGPAHYGLAIAYTRLGKAEQAQQHFNLHEKYRLSEPVIADTLLDEVARLQGGAYFHVRQGIYLASSGRLREAVQSFERALAVYPEELTAHISLMVLFEKLGDTGRVESAYKQAVRMIPNVAELHFTFGSIVSRQGRSRPAETALRRAIALNPLYFEAHADLASLLERRGRRSEAVRHYKRALEIRPGFWSAHARLGRLLAAEGRYPEAIGHLEKALRGDAQHDPAVLYELARVCRKIGRTHEAREYLRQALPHALLAGPSELLEDINKLLTELNKQAGGGSEAPIPAVAGERR